MATTNYFFYCSKIYGYDSQDNGQLYGDDFNKLVPILDNTPDAQPNDLRVRADKRIDSVQMYYPGNVGSIPLNKYGGNGGSETAIGLTPGNEIIKIEFWGAIHKNGNRLGKMIITLEGGDSITVGTTHDEDLGTFTAPKGYVVGGLRAYHGGDSGEVNGMGVLLIPALVYTPA